MAKTVVVPVELIQKLTKWKRCMSYNDSYFGEPAGLVKQVVYELDRIPAAPASASLCLAQQDEREDCPNCGGYGRRYESHGNGCGEYLACDLCEASFIRNAILDVCNGGDVDRAVKAAYQEIKQHYSAALTAQDAQERELDPHFILRLAGGKLSFASQSALVHFAKTVIAEWRVRNASTAVVMAVTAVSARPSSRRSR
jgi:hypothetical protein